MLILDQLREADRRLRLVALGVSLGMVILLAGLWYVQIISAKKYVTNLKDQAFRNVLIAAPRGKILDRNGALLAENQPLFVVNVYLEDLRGQFTHEYTNRVRKEWVAANPGKKLSSATKGQLSRQSRYNVVSNIVWQVSSAILPQPLILQERAFAKHYNESLALPMPILSGLTHDQVALFMERAAHIPGVELEALPIRLYPEGQLAVHLLGYVRREVVHSDEDEAISFIDKTPVLVGKSGIESTFDEQLRGRPGMRSILVNNLGYRQREEVWASPIPGQNVTLALDVEIQRAAEQALRASGADTRGAAVVMDVRTGDVLACASSPSYDPNLFLARVAPDEWEKINDPQLRPLLNRALYGSYAPGSTFKMITGLAALEAGVDPRTTIYNPGYYKLGRRPIDDTAPPGTYDFREAIKHSCNTYFIEFALRMGSQRLIDMGNRFMLGERTRVVSRGYEVSGYFPETGQRYKKDGGLWMDGDTANLSIGQGEITVTPLQMAVVTAAVANGGKVFQPRLVKSIGPGLVDGSGRTMPPAEIINDVRVNPAHLDVLREAMHACVNDGGGGKEAKVPGLNVCGKTGTAQVLLKTGMDHITWFCSFFPYESPRYTVVVMVESGASGGKSCAPKAAEIIKAIARLEQKQQAQPLRPMAVNN